MNLPNYYDGSIVNLMSSIEESFGSKSEYKPLKLLSPKELKNSRNIVLIIIDGLGFEYLKKKNSILKDYLIGSITSVFPPTTASAITTFLTGVSPKQHAITGWFMHLKEIGTVVKILPFTPRFGGPPLDKYKFRIKDILNQKAFYSKIKTNSYFINHKDIVNSDFTKTMSKNVKGYKTLDGFFKEIKKIIRSNRNRKYVYAYWPELDSLNHEYGVGSKKSEKHFKEINKKIKEFIKSIKNTTLIITSDHGFINTTKEKVIWLENHPKLKECLTFPLCGEGRVVYCYVHPDKTKEFEAYIKKYFKNYCYLFKSKELIEKNYFGLFEPNPKLFDRVGDYVLVMKDNFILKDKIENKKEKIYIGYHGGITKEEMIVPLIVIKT